MTTMDPSGPDAPVLDPKPHNAVREMEHKSELNGHVDNIAPQSEPQSEPKTVSPPPDQATNTEKQPDTKPDAIAGADRLLLNGSYPSREEQKSIESANTTELAGEPGPRSDEEPKHVSETSSQTTVKLEGQSAPATESKILDKSSPTPDEKPKVPTEPSDDVAIPNRSPLAAAAVEESDIRPPPGQIAADDAQDTEMTDAPPEKAEEPSASGKPTVVSQVATALPTSEADRGSSNILRQTIESTEKASVPAEALPIVEAPGVKVARERDDDTNEEPAPKRARTEPEEDKSGLMPSTADAPSDAHAEVVVSGAESPILTSTSLHKLANWLDEETNKREISQFQRREMRKVISRVKKTKAGGHFRDTVQKMWPGLWDSYVVKVDRPMDLAELERGLRDLNGPYDTYGKFRTDLMLIYDNSLSFNGPLHHITASAASAVRAVWEEVLTIPFEEPAKPKAVPKTKPVRESRAAANADAARRQSAGPPTASPAAEAPANKAAVVTLDQSADRRSSTATEGDRPKRTVRAPKPKDIDYTTKPSRKKLKPELQFAEEVLAEIMSLKNHELNNWFMEPVDAEGLNIPDYYSVIKKPMDLSKASRMLSGGEISNLKEFDKTVRLIFDNCYKFNGPVDQGNLVSALAKQLEEIYLAQMKGKDAWMAKYAKANAPASASNASDDDEDEEEDGDDAGDAPVDTKAIEELQTKLDEETKKLNSMFLTANQNLIDVQKNIVDMIQKTLIEKAREIQSARSKAKSDKPKKATKSAKPKTAGSGGRKSTGGGGQPKKAGGSKKAGPKKSLTAADKDQIANAINDLDGANLDRAIDIIKRDTGQNENKDGELELDIDQLSTDALLKLWELCKKALPNFAQNSAPAAPPEVSRPSAKQAAAASNKSAGGKPKKNKPMSAQEQEARIAQLKELRGLYKDGQEPGDETGTMHLTPGAGSSDDSDSEEE